VGDDLPIGSSATRRFDADTSFGPLPFALTERRLRAEDLKKLYDRDRPVRILRGPQFDLFDERDRNKFLNEAFEVSTSSDRMGYRLCGPALDSAAREELTSSAVLAGTVQVPPSGEPIILMADRQTTGGYPVIGLVVTADLSLLAQLCPGNQVLFEEVTLEYAQTALRSQAKLVQSFKTEVVTYASSRP
jgi:antagonist of KipI